MLVSVDLFLCRKEADAEHLGRTREHENCLPGQKREVLRQHFLLQCRKSVNFRPLVHSTQLKYRSLPSSLHAMQAPQQH